MIYIYIYIYKYGFDTLLEETINKCKNTLFNKIVSKMITFKIINELIWKMNIFQSLYMKKQF